MFFWNMTNKSATFVAEKTQMKEYARKMSSTDACRFRDDVLSIVGQIPRGRVTTYGAIAAWAGWPDHARMVGRILRLSPDAKWLPCHRVVNAVGRTAPGWLLQRQMLEGEGIAFKPNGHVEISRHLWLPEVE